MQTFCLVSPDSNWQQERIAQMRAQYEVEEMNFHTILPTPSIGIDAVRDAQQLVSRKPYGGGDRLIVFSGMEKATIEAQNALLKLLEEPPFNTYIILTTSSEDALLSTIRSRSYIIRYQSSPVATSDSIMVIKKIVNARPGERILAAQDYAKTKEETLVFLQSLISSAHHYLHAPATDLPLTMGQWATILKNTENARRYVERNVNFKATVDILFLGFPKVP